MKHAIILPLLCLALHACDAQPEHADDELNPSLDEQMMPVEPDGGIGDGAEPLTGTASADVADENTVPNRFIGVWDYIKGTCDPASDMRLEIGQTEFGFYESVGQLAGVRHEGEAIVVDLDMAGEGETWTESLRLVLKDEGTRLHVTEPQAESDVDEYPRRRCPA
uniref:hypothetical protein n=1 Tax=Parerythrobacter lutipelagi TaxID=1964208 RepID=UPI0010F6BCA3|nr:hypothetical protein [Parerythrobacter lutipelagi]